MYFAKNTTKKKPIKENKKFVILPISFLWSRKYLLLLSLKLKSPHENPDHDHIQIRDYRTTSP